jgi:hypothetical protein
MAFALMHANEGAEALLASRLAAFVYGAPPSIRHKRNSACDSNAGDETASFRDFGQFLPFSF